MKKSINNFNTHSLTLSETANIKGGYSFCEWYMDKCIRQGKNPSHSKMMKMMQRDMQAGITPDMSSYGTITWA